MGTIDFATISNARGAKSAFNKAVKEARKIYGTGGYSGTIAEKDSFVMIPVPVGEDPKKYANKLLDNDDSRIENKWGPAGCVKVNDGEFLFFGFASC